MNKIFLNTISLAFLAGLLFTAYPVQAQRKKTVSKKPVVSSKTKVVSKKSTVPTKQTVQNPETATTQAPVPNHETQILLTRIETNTGIYRRELTRALSRNNLNGTDSEASINAYIADFENAAKTLRSRVDSGTDSVADVQDVLNRAEFIQGFQRDNSLSPAVQSQWKLLADNLVTLANSYKVSWNPNTLPAQNNQSYVPNNPPNNQPNYPVNQPNYTGNQPRNYSGGARFDSMITGTYRLNVSQSDNVSSVLDRILNTTTNNQANNQTAETQEGRMRRSLERRLASPEMFVIEKKNTDVTIASNLSPQVTVSADNVARAEVSPSGRSVSVKASALNNALEISYQGDRINDFFLTFMPVDNRQLRVTRRLYLENSNQTVTVTSVYDKILPSADFTVVNTNQNRGQNNPNTPDNPNPGVSNDFVIPNGTQLIAVLNTALSTQSAREGDRFAMEVSAPAQFAGAVIEGFLSNTQQSAGVSNRAQVTFNFDRIRLRSGRSFSFTGLIDLARLPSGDTVSVINNTGNNVNQPRPQATRSGVGGSLGAILGAILTGGQNVPAETTTDSSATGSGTIILQGRNNFDLPSGTEFRIVASVPANLKANN